MADPKKNSDPSGCLSCGAVLVVIGILVGVGGVIGSGELPEATWGFFAFAALAFFVHRRDKKNPQQAAHMRAKLQAKNVRNLPQGWLWDDRSAEIAQMWGHEPDMFDATHYLNVVRGRSHKHDVALVTPAGGRSSGFYLVVKLNTPLVDFDWLTDSPPPSVAPPLDRDFFDHLNTLTAPGRPCGIRNGCFWVEVPDYSTFNPAASANDFAELINEYDHADAGGAAVVQGPTVPKVSELLAPSSESQPAEPTTWPALPAYSMEQPAPGQPMAFEAVDAVDSTGRPISGKKTKSMPKFEEPAEWTVQQWRPSSDWKPDTTWTPPSYTPTSWEPASGSSLFGAPSSLSREPEQPDDPAGPGKTGSDRTK